MVDKQNEKHRASLASELCDRNGYCGEIKYEDGLPVWICVKSKHDKHEHAYQTKITSVIPF